MPLCRLTAHHDHEGLAGLVVPLDDEPGFPEPFAVILDGNLLAPDPPAIPANIPAPRLIAWSGTLAEGAMFDRDVRTWMPAGLEAFRSMCDAVRPFLDAAGVRLLFRSHARHVLCDPHRCATLLREWRDIGAPFALALDAAAMLEQSMLTDAEDHLERAFGALAPLADAVILANAGPDGAAQPADQDAAPPLLTAPLHRGVIDPALLLKPWRRHTPPTTPTILLDEDVQAQRRLLAPNP